MNNLPLGAVCQHGHLARQCELCERDDEIKELKTQLDAALAYGAPVSSAVAIVKRKYQCAHNEYWTTNSGECMACRAVKAEAALAAANADPNDIEYHTPPPKDVKHYRLVPVAEWEALQQAREERDAAIEAVNQIFPSPR